MTDEDALLDAVERYVDAAFDEFERDLKEYYYRTGRLPRRGASAKTLRKRVKYGGRKGRRAARRLGLTCVGLGRGL